jgi:nicotinamidase-related amidase
VDPKDSKAQQMTDDRLWDRFLTEQDRQVFPQSGYGARQGFGKRPALLVVDVTIGFVGASSMPVLESNRDWPDSCGDIGWAAVAEIARLLERARAVGVPVIYTKGVEPTPDGIASGRWADKNSRWGAPGRRAEANDIVPDIAPVDGEVVICKPKPSAFFASGLLSLLVDLGVDQLIVCGTTTSGCVRATVVDGFSMNYRVAVVEEATFDRGEASHAMNLFDMDLKYADVVRVEDALSYLDDCGTAAR